MARSRLLPFAFIACLLPCLYAHASDSTRLAVPLVLDGSEFPYPEFAIYVMPGAALDIKLARDGRAEYRSGHGGGVLGETSLHAPMEHGLERWQDQLSRWRNGLSR